jgi:hypothetical protein
MKAKQLVQLWLPQHTPRQRLHLRRRDTRQGAAQQLAFTQLS